MSINRVTLLGNACSDAKVTTFDNGGKTCYFSLATNEKGYTSKEGYVVADSTEFHNIVIKKPGLVDVAEKYVKKGGKLYVEGKIKSRTIGMEDGYIKNVHEIIVDVMELLGTPSRQQ